MPPLRRVRRWLQHAALVAGGLLVGFVLVEAGFRLTGRVLGVDYRLYLEQLTQSGTLALGIWEPGTTGSLETVAERAYQRYPPLRANVEVLATTSDYSVVYRTNSRGLRDREYALAKPPGTRRVLAFGDSFTFGSGVDDADRFTEVAERRLPGVEILNMGVPGYGLDQILLSFLVQGRPYAPDVVAVFLNDHVADRHRTGIFDGEVVRIPERLDAVVFTGTGGGTAFFGPGHPFWGRDRSWLVRHSYALAWATYQLRVRQLRETLAADDAKFWARQRSLNDRLALHEDPKTQRQARTVALLRALRDAVEAAGARFLVVNIDHQVSVAFLAGADPDLHVVDLSGRLAGREQREPLTFTYDQHYNASTNRFLGDVLRDVLAERLAQPERADAAS